MNPPNVLIVDDDIVDAERVSRLLRRAGVAADCRHASTPAELEARMAETRFDVVLLDYVLPGATAHDLLPRIRATQPDAAIIVLTGQGDERIAVEVMKAGALDYVAKDDLSLERLRSSITHSSTLHAARRAAERADSALRERAAKLRLLVTQAPRIAQSRDPREIASSAVDLLSALLDTDAAVVTFHLPTPHEQARGDNADHIGRAREMTCSDPSRQRTSQGRTERVRPLLSSSSAQLGCMTAISESVDEASEQVRDNLLAQLAQIVSGALDTAILIAEKQAAILARDDVLAVVSHDLRGPLSNLNMALGLLGETDPRLRDSIGHNVSHMSRLVDDLVDLARLEHGSFDLTPSDTSLAELGRAMVTQFAPQAKTKDVALNFVMRHEAKVHADAHRLRQVLANLVSNALKFTPTGGTVEVTVSELENQALIEVKDTGPGIKESDAAKVFARYWSKDARRAGLGLGLYIAKAIIDAHKGRIGFDSVVGEGTRFYVLLPRA